VKENKFDVFLRQSDFASPILKQAKLNHVTIDPAKKLWTFDILLEEVIAPEALFAFIQTMKSYFFKPSVLRGIDVVIHYQKHADIGPYAKVYFDFVVLELAKDKASFLVLKNFKASFDRNTYTLIVDPDSTYVKEYFATLKTFFQQLGFSIGFELQVAEDLVPVSQLIESSIDEQNTLLKEKKKVIKKQESVETKKRVFSRKRNPDAVAIREIPIDQYRLDQYKNEKGDTKFVVEGVIDRVEVRRLKRSELLTLVIADEDDAIYAKRFLNTDEDKEFARALKEGDRVSVIGIAEFDTFQKTVVLMLKQSNCITYLNATPKTERTDHAKKKRIEFHVHTKMSSMDAVTDVEEYVDRATKWGHEAIAFTDHNNLHAYPEIAKVCYKKKIKPIYGVELDFVDEARFRMTTPVKEDRNLKDATFVVFDIETTGLSITRDKIIEIGAVKVVSNTIVERFQTFVNPDEPLTDATTKFTSITDEMVRDAPTIDQAMISFLDFAKDSILVAHNASFDVGHIKENARVLGLDFNSDYVIDTLNMARYFYHESLKRFNLKAVAKHFKVNLEQHHRADADAEATAQILLTMLSDLTKRKIRTYSEIDRSIDLREAWKHEKPYHINVLVQNQKGYKNLFRLISDALTDHFHSGPRTLSSVLKTYREGLLVGSGCSHGNVFEAALNGDDETLKEAIAFYDYIEVQPPEAYRHLKADLGEYADEIIEAVITKIVRYAKEAGKIVIATGDVHYLDQKDVLYREIYIRTPLVGGGIHDLFPYDRMPDQYFLSTEEMLERMRFLGDDLAAEITIENTHVLNRKIDRIKAFPDDLYSLPDDAFKDTLGIESITDEVRRLVYDKLQYLYGNEPHPYITERVSRELSNIIDNRFAPIYYMSHLLVKKSLEDGYLVGSRGSVGSSLVATLLDITEVNPLRPHYRCPNGDFTAFYFTEEEIHRYGVTPEQKAFFQELKAAQSGYDLKEADCPICGAKLAKDGHNIPFETFLGFKGDKVPDIDLNFSGEYQAKAHAYVRELLGEDHTFRAGTIQTVAERNAFGYVKGYLEDKNLTFRKAQIERLAKKIQGVRRSTGQHPGGIVVVPKSQSIFDVTPIQYPANDTNSEWKTTHFDYHSFESNLLKLDILGHDDPTMLKYLMDYVNLNPDDFPFDRAQDIPVDDPRVYRIFSRVDAFNVDDDDAKKEIGSFGIPEFGTPFTRQMLTAIRPNTFAGLVKISGLSHGTDVWLKNAQALIDNTTQYGTIDFNDIIACRDDIMVQLAEFGLEPDRAFEIMEFVRKGKPSKDPVKWLEYEQEMRQNGVPEWYIWSAGQIKYMFPKAHATAYVIMAMRIAWFKVYKPLLFYSAFFSKRASHFEYDTMVAGKSAIRKRIIELSQGYGRTAKDENLLVTLSVAHEMVLRGFTFLPVDIHTSLATTFRMEEGGLRMPFSTIDGLGAAVAEDVCNNRLERPFDSVADIKRRTRLNKTLFDKLMDYGAFGDLKSENNVIDDGLFAL